jgi:monoamine oxidase
VTYDYAIIGAGASGLAAARALSGAGKRICILEARDRIGGRVLSLELPDLPVPIELGAEFIHGEAEATFRIIDAAGLGVCEIPDEHWWSRSGRWTRIDDYQGQIARVRARIGGRTRDLSFDAFLRSRRALPSRLRELAYTYVEGYHAAHADRMSALALRTADGEQEDSATRQFRLTGRQDALLAWLRAGLDPDETTLRLGTIVTSVEWSRGRVTLHTSAGDRVRASALIVTIPIGVWKAPEGEEGAIRFDPPLSEKTGALEKIASGHVVKLTLRFRERFWNDAFIASRLEGRSSSRALNFIHTSETRIPTWWTTAPLRSPILIGWAGGHAADSMLAEGEGSWKNRALESLSATFGVPRRRLESLLAGIHAHNWQSDPFSRCAYSYATVGGRNAHALLARPIRNTLFFAGEATSGDETGTVSGALSSGVRAAREVLRAK